MRYGFILLILTCLLILVWSWNRFLTPERQERQVTEVKSPQVFRRMTNDHVAETLRKIEKVKAEEDPPEIKKLAELLARFQADEDAWDCLIAVGDLYKNGAYPRFLPNEYIALNCYKTAAMCPDGDVAGLAQAKYVEVRSESISEEDKKGKPLPTKYGESICQIAMERISTTPYSHFSKPKNQTKTPEVAIMRDTDIDNIDWLDAWGGGDAWNALGAPREWDWLGAAGGAQTQRDAVGRDTTNVFRSDSQNVHDHSVMSISKINLEKLQETTPKNTDALIDEIRKNIKSNPGLTDVEASDAMHVLESLGTGTHSTFNKSEKEVLADVWSKIKQTPDATLQTNLIETLGKQLASGVEHGHVVCSTGKITRMIGTFEGTDVLGTNTRPLWAIKEEIANLAGKVRAEYTDTLSDIQRVAYDKGDLPELDEKIKDKFKADAHKIYYDELQMNPSIIDPIVQLYSDAI